MGFSATGAPRRSRPHGSRPRLELEQYHRFTPHKMSGVRRIDRNGFAPEALFSDAASEKSASGANPFRSILLTPDILCGVKRWYCSSSRRGREPCGLDLRGAPVAEKPIPKPSHSVGDHAY